MMGWVLEEDGEILTLPEGTAVTMKEVSSAILGVMLGEGNTPQPYHCRGSSSTGCSVVVRMGYDNMRDASPVATPPSMRLHATHEQHVVPAPLAGCAPSCSTLHLPPAWVCFSEMAARLSSCVGWQGIVGVRGQGRGGGGRMWDAQVLRCWCIPSSGVGSSWVEVQVLWCWCRTSCLTSWQ